VATCYEHSNESVGSVKGGEFLHLMKKNTTLEIATQKLKYYRQHHIVHNF
jgi:hypothetical protein